MAVFTPPVPPRPTKAFTVQHKASLNTHGDSSTQKAMTHLSGASLVFHLLDMCESKVCKCDHRLRWHRVHQAVRLWKRMLMTWERRTDFSGDACRFAFSALSSEDYNACIYGIWRWYGCVNFDGYRTALGHFDLESYVSFSILPPFSC
jgi:hypothetical protein